MRGSIRLTALLSVLVLEGCAQPASPQLPPQPQPRDSIYLIFFDWDRAALTQRGLQIITEFARNEDQRRLTRIEVHGHADRSGSPAYNQRLSLRRAEAVAAELERLGVNPALIRVMGFGEARLLVPTADGVQEPQNRYVEIIRR